MLKIKGIGELSTPICAVVHLSHQMAGVVHQVVLDPAKVKLGEDDVVLIRLGDWPGDEARGWQLIGNVRVVAVLGRASVDENKIVTVVPMESEKESLDPGE